MRRIIILGGLIFFSLCFSTESLACDCMTPPAEEGFRRSAAVFIGEVIRVDEGPSGKPAGSIPSRITTYTFRVSKVLKGKDAPKVVVTSLGSNCDYIFGVGTFYLVYAGKFEGKLISSICSGNTALGSSTKQSPCLQPSKTSMTVPGYRYVATAVALGMLLALLVWLVATSSRQRTA